MSHPVVLVLLLDLPVDHLAVAVKDGHVLRLLEVVPVVERLPAAIELGGLRGNLELGHHVVAHLQP